MSDAYPDDLPRMLRPLWDDHYDIHQGDPAAFRAWLVGVIAAWNIA